MEKQKLLDRLVDLEAAIANKNQEVNQAMADLNFLLGQKAEVNNLLSGAPVVVDAEPVGEVVA